MPVGESKDCNRKPVAAQRGVGADRRGCPAVEVRPPSASSSCIPDEGRLGASWPMMRASPLNVDASCICSLVSSLAALGLKSCFGGGCCWLAVEVRGSAGRTHSMEDETTSTVVDVEGEEIAFAGGAIGHRRCRYSQGHRESASRDQIERARAARALALTEKQRNSSDSRP